MPKCRPLTDEEIEIQIQKNMLDSLWPVQDDVGVDIQYPFTVTKYSDAPSKSSGNEMLSFQLKCYKDDGSHRFIDVYLAFMKEPKEEDFLKHEDPKSMFNKSKKKYYFMMGNVKKFYSCIGLKDFYDQGRDLAGSEALDMNGVITMKIQTSDGYPPKNVVDKFISPESVDVRKKEETFKDDDIPF